MNDQSGMADPGSVLDDFEWCSIRWTGPGGVYDVGGLGVEGHVCAQHRPGHQVHVCCCGASRPGGAA